MINRRLAVLAIALVASCGLAAAQGNRDNNKTNPAPTPTKVDAPSVAAVAAGSPALPIDPKSFVIGAEDIFRISVWRDETLSGTVAVRPDGKITRPLIGDVQAAGLTPERLTATLKEAYKSFVNNPEITIEMLQINSRHYAITGEVNRPGMFPLVVPLTVFEALNLSGGFKEFANKKSITILRDNGKILKFNWEAFSKGKDRDKNVALQPGDTIIVN